MLRRAKKPPTARPAKQQPKQLTGHKARVAANEAKVLAERKAKRLKALARESAPPRRLVNLKWEPDVFTDETIDLQGRKIRRQEGGNSWTLGSALPTRGRHAWRCRIDHTHNNRGGLFIGVCDSGGTFARVFCPGTGSLHCIGLGQLAPDMEDGVLATSTQVLVDQRGQPCTLQGKANGSVVEVIVDVNRGELLFRINGGPILPGFVGLPRKDELRPCVGMHRPGDQVTLLARGLSKLQGAKEREQRYKRRVQHLVAQQQNSSGSAHGGRLSSDRAARNRQLVRL